MELSAKQRAETGAFYTPKMWADFCVERLHRVLPTFEGFTFYDPAAGEGEEGEVFRCPCCGFFFRFTDK